MTTGAPQIQTSRLILRAHRMSDLPACRAMWADPIVTRYIGAKPSTPQQTWMRVLAYAGHWSLLGFGYWAIFDRETDAFVGELGFADFKRNVDSRLDGLPELGWAIATEVAGRGFATEAALAATAWGDTHFTNPRTTCMIDIENTRSLAVANKCGYTIFDLISMNGRQTHLLERARRTDT